MNENQIDKPYIESQVNDWLKRVNDLYSFVGNNLSNDTNVRSASTKKMLMHEELMQKYNVSSVSVPILDLYKNDKILATFKPIGLWVIGANGRIDILTEKGAYILVDVAEKGRSAEWQAYEPSQRRKAIKFDADFIKNLVK